VGSWGTIIREGGSRIGELYSYLKVKDARANV
jgi:hypothetical protein